MSSSGGFKGDLSGETRKALIEELKQLRRRVDELELIEAERERAEDALRESEARFRSLADNLPGAVFQRKLTPEGRLAYTYVSPRVRDLYGLEPQDIVADASVFLDAMPVEDRDRWMAALDHSAPTLSPMDLQVRVIAADGATCWIHTISRPTRDENGEVVWDGVDIDITERKRAEEALRESGARHREIFEQSPIGIWEEDYSGVKRMIDRLRKKGVRDFRRYFREHPRVLRQMVKAIKVIDVNPAVLDIHRAPDKETFMQWEVNPARIDSWMSFYEQGLAALAEGETRFALEHADKSFDGSDIVLRVITSIGEAHKDNWARVVSTTEDITERKRTEEAVRESEARHRELFELSPIGLWEQDYSAVKPMIDRLRRKGVRDFRRYFREHPGVLRKMVEAIKVIDVNPAVLDLYREPDKETLLRAESDPARIDAWMSFYEEELAALAAGESRFVLEYADKAFDGSDIVVRVITHIGEAYKDSWARVVSTTEDITEQKRAEDARRETEQRLADIAANMPGGIYRRVLHTDGRISYSYTAAETVYGLDSKAVMEDPDVFIDAIHPDDHAKWHEAVKASAKKLEHFDLEMRVITPSGETRWVQSMAQPHRLANGDVVWDGVMIDITEQKKAQERAREHEKELAEVLRRTTMGEMASALAHELNQPLASILNYCRGCLLRTQSGQWTSGDFIDALEKTCEQAERAGRIIHHVRDFVCASEPQESQVNVNDIIRAMVPFAKAEANEQGVWLRLDLADAIPPVSAQQIEIEHVVLNLVRNGIEAIMDDNGEKRELTVRTSMSGREAVEITVHDTGRGVPTEIRDQIFKPFYTTKKNSMGMGLAISRSIIERHGGRIWTTPNAECGTTFRFTLPIVKDGASP